MSGNDVCPLCGETYALLESVDESGEVKRPGSRHCLVVSGTTVNVYVHTRQATNTNAGP